jgi:hypothetical protein
MTTDQIHIEYCRASIDVAKTALQRLKEVPAGFDRSISSGFSELVYRSEINRWQEVLSRYENIDNDHTTGGEPIDDDAENDQP